MKAKEQMLSKIGLEEPSNFIEIFLHEIEKSSSQNFTGFQSFKIT
jgi:hypothetical protein